MTDEPQPDLLPPESSDEDDEPPLPALTPVPDDVPDTAAGDLWKIYYQARIDEDKYKRNASQRRLDDQRERLKKETEAEVELYKKYNDTLIDVAKASIERYRSNADLVQKAAGTLGTAYTGLLALVFSIKDNPLPMRGIWPPIFFAISLVAAIAYLAFIRKQAEESGPISAPRSDPRARQAYRVDFFFDYVNSVVRDRALYLRLSVTALAVGVALMPLPFLNLYGTSAAAPKPPEISWPALPSNDSNAARLLFAAQLYETYVKRAEPPPKASGPKKDPLWLIVAIGLTGFGAMFVLERGAARKWPD